MSQNVVVGWSRTGKMTFLLGPRSSPLYAKGAYCIVIRTIGHMGPCAHREWSFEQNSAERKKKKIRKWQKNFQHEHTACMHAYQHIGALGAGTQNAAPRKVCFIFPKRQSILFIALSGAAYFSQHYAEKHTFYSTKQRSILFIALSQEAYFLQR